MVQVKKWWSEVCKICPWIDRMISVTLRLMLIFLSLYGAYLIVGWWQDDQPVVTYGMGEVSTPTAHPGDILIFHQPLKKTKTCWGSVQRVLVGECGFLIVSEAPAWVLAPWEGRLTYAIQIPVEAIPGNCGFQVVGRFICNPFDLFGRPRLSSSTPIPFRVLPFNESDP